MEEKAKKGLEPYVTPEITVYDLELEQAVLAGSGVTYGFESSETEEVW